MHQTPLASLFFCFILLLTLQTSLSYTNTGVSITDLETTDSTGFNAEAASWTVSDAWNGIVYQTLAHNGFPAMYVVGGPKSLGGLFTLSPGEYFQRVYTGISPHTFIHFTATFWYFDQWWGDRVIVKLYFDGTVISAPQVRSISDMTMQNGGSDNSAGTGRDLGFNHVYAGVAHTGPTLTLRMISQQQGLSFASLSFGFRDISLLFSDYAGTVTTCHRSEEINTLTYNQCPCALGQALDSATGTCTACAGGCDICFGADAPQCLKCESSTYFTGSECYFEEPEPSEPEDPEDPEEPTEPSDPGDPGSDPGSDPESDEENEEKEEESKPLASTAGPIAQNSAKVMAILQLQGPSLFSIVGLSEMMQYIRYLKINYPEKLLKLFQTLNASPISLPFDIDMPEALNKDLPNRVLPDVFEYYKLDSSFLLNYWKTLVSLVVVFVAVIALLFLNTCTKNFKRINLLIKKLLKILKWNLFLTYFCSGFGEAMFFGILDLRTLKLDSFLGVLSLCVIVLAFFGILVVFFQSFTIALVRQRCRKEKSSLQGFEDYEVLFEGCKDGSFLQLLYMTAIFSREAFCGILTSALDGFPLLQAIMLVLLSLIMSGLCVFCRPLKDLLEQMITIINELLLLVVNVCVLIYAILDQQESDSKEMRDIMADIIIKISSIFCICAIVFMAISLAIILFRMYKRVKTLREKGITSVSETLKKAFQAFLAEEEESSLDQLVVVRPVREMNRSQFSQKTMQNNLISPELNLTETSTSMMRSRSGSGQTTIRSSSMGVQQDNSSLGYYQAHENPSYLQGSYHIPGLKNFQNSGHSPLNFSNCSFENNNTEDSFSRATHGNVVQRRRIKRGPYRPQRKILEIASGRSAGGNNWVLPLQLGINHQLEEARSIRMPINNKLYPEERINHYQVPKRKGRRIKFPGND